MLKSYFEKEFEKISIEIGIIFSKFGISPNVWTILALIPSLIGFFALYYGNLLTGTFFFIISGIIDAIDGAVARVTKSVSNLGAFLDGIIDRYVEIIMYLAIWFYLQRHSEISTSISSFWIILLIFGAMMPSFVRAYAHHRNVVIDAEDQKRMGGLIERYERLDLLYLGMILGYFNIRWLLYMIAIVAILSNWTALQRISFVVGYKSK